MTKYTEILEDLYDYCRWDKYKRVSQILDENSTKQIDILYDDGILVGLALSSHTTDLLRVLLDYYYDQYKLNQPIEDYTLEQIAAKHKLREILLDNDVPEQMEKVLKEEYTINLDGNDDEGSSDSAAEEDNMVISDDKHSSSDLEKQFENNISQNKENDSNMHDDLTCSRQQLDQSNLIGQDSHYYYLIS